MKHAFIKLTALAALCATLLCGCGEKPVELDINALAAELAGSNIFKEEMNNMSKNVLEKRYGIKEEDFVEYAAGAGTRAVVDEYLIIKTDGTNPDKAAQVTAAIEKHISNQRSNYSDYRPSEVPKLDNRVLVTYGDYQILVVSDSSVKAQEIINKYTTE